MAMSKAIFFDCFSGISGDMLVGALLDAGLPLDHLSQELEKLGVKNFSLSAQKVVKGNISATKFEVVPGHEHTHRHLQHIEKILEESHLASRVKELALQIFRRLADAEAHVHGTTPEKIHFHEVGAIDSIVDIIGVCIGFDYFGIEKFRCSALNVGRGTIRCAHGILPVPAPATAEMLRGIPIYSNHLDGELVTPTGAAIMSTLCSDFGGVPFWKIERSGFGAGSRDFPESANVARIMVGDTMEIACHSASSSPDNSVVVLEANIDDMNPQIYGFLQDKLFDLGVLDFFTSPVQMKKNRPGTLLSVVVPLHLRKAAADLIFRETTTIGLRYYESNRMVLQRDIEQVEVAGLPVRIKISRLEGTLVNYAPEYEDCRQIADAKGMPFKVVYSFAIQEFLTNHAGDML
jgi:pyridinium-3,5-bisthiocarboxylic acid mononucleotide nickel chelatase